MPVNACPFRFPRTHPFPAVSDGPLPIASWVGSSTTGLYELAALIAKGVKRRAPAAVDGIYHGGGEGHVRVLLECTEGAHVPLHVLLLLVKVAQPALDHITVSEQ